jgi:hypothetical protein
MSLPLPLPPPPPLLLRLSSADVHFFATTVNHGGNDSAINIQMSTTAGTCVISSFGSFDRLVHQNSVWDGSKQALRGFDAARRLP